MKDHGAGIPSEYDSPLRPRGYQGKPRQDYDASPSSGEEPAA
jgi:hypothetical protein